MAPLIAAATPTTTWYLVLSAVLFGIGTVGVLVRRNPLVMFMCIELMLNAVNLSFVALAKRMGDIGGQTTVFFVMVVAAAEVDCYPPLKGQSAGQDGPPGGVPHRAKDSPVQHPARKASGDRHFEDARQGLRATE